MRLQPIENLSKTYSGDPHLGQTKLNGLLLLTIHGVLAGVFSIPVLRKPSKTIFSIFLLRGYSPIPLPPSPSNPLTGNLIAQKAKRKFLRS